MSNDKKRFSEDFDEWDGQVSAAERLMIESGLTGEESWVSLAILSAFFASSQNNSSAINTAINNLKQELIGGSPTSLDAFNELAAALNNDPNFATTIMNQLAGKAPKANPSFSGEMDLHFNSNGDPNGDPVFRITDLFGNKDIIKADDWGNIDMSLAREVFVPAAISPTAAVQKQQVESDILKKANYKKIEIASIGELDRTDLEGIYNITGAKNGILLHVNNATEVDGVDILQVLIDSAKIQSRRAWRNGEDIEFGEFLPLNRNSFMGINSSVIQTSGASWLDIDWGTNGTLIIEDADDAAYRPTGLRVPDYNTTITYDCLKVGSIVYMHDRNMGDDYVLDIAGNYAHEKGGMGRYLEITQYRTPSVGWAETQWALPGTYVVTDSPEAVWRPIGIPTPEETIQYECIRLGNTTLIINCQKTGCVYTWDFVGINPVVKLHDPNTASLIAHSQIILTSGDSWSSIDWASLQGTVTILDNEDVFNRPTGLLDPTEIGTITYNCVVYKDYVIMSTPVSPTPYTLTLSANAAERLLSEQQLNDNIKFINKNSNAGYRSMDGASWSNIIATVIEEGCYIIIDYPNAYDRPSTLPEMVDGDGINTYNCSLVGFSNDNQIINRTLKMHLVGTNRNWTWDFDYIGGGLTNPIEDNIELTNAIGDLSTILDSL